MNEVLNISKLTFNRCIAKTIDVLLTWILTIIFVSIYFFYAFNKTKNYLINLYNSSIDSYSVSKEVINERTIDLENTKTIYEFIKLLLKYDSLEVIVTSYGILFLGGYITFYLISLILIEMIFVNKEGQTIGKRICYIKLDKNKSFIRLSARMFIIYFLNFFVLITLLFKIRGKRAMLHEHVLNEYVILKKTIKKE